MQLTPVVCVYELLAGGKIRHVGIYYNTGESPDPDESFTIIPNRNSGFSVVMSLEEITEFLEHQGMTNLLAAVNEKMQEAKESRGSGRRSKMSSEELIRQLKVKMGVTEPI